LYEAREEIVNKVEGQTASGLRPEEEPYYNKLRELFEGQRDNDTLKAMAAKIHKFIEDRVTPIPDWTSKNDFKRRLNADLKIMLLKDHMSMSDASMLTGYFTALAEVQYGK